MTAPSPAASRSCTRCQFRSRVFRGSAAVVMMMAHFHRHAREQILSALMNSGLICFRITAVRRRLPLYVPRSSNFLRPGSLIWGRRLLFSGRRFEAPTKPYDAPRLASGNERQVQLRPAPITITFLRGYFAARSQSVPLRNGPKCCAARRGAISGDISPSNLTHREFSARATCAAPVHRQHRPFARFQTVQFIIGFCAAAITGRQISIASFRRSSSDRAPEPHVRLGAPLSASMSATVPRSHDTFGTILRRCR